MFCWGFDIIFSVRKTAIVIIAVLAIAVSGAPNTTAVETLGCRLLAALEPIRGNVGFLPCDHSLPTTATENALEVTKL